MMIHNQKNGWKNHEIHQEASGLSTCPIRALAYRVHHILSNGGNDNDYICAYYTKKRKYHVTATMVNKTLKTAVTALHLEQNGITTDMVSSHSLRAGGATAMKMHGYSDTRIQKMGRWRGATFLQYIHHQIQAFSKGISRKMNKEIKHFNIRLIQKSTSERTP